MNMPSMTEAYDRATAQLQAGLPITLVLNTLFHHLQRYREQSAAAAWKAMLTAHIQHPLHLLMREDPFTWRAAVKPRGYAGDAEMMDLLYAPEGVATPAALHHATPLGHRIYAYTAHIPGSQAVRNRRRIVQDWIDVYTEHHDAPQILSLACGHLREAQTSVAMQSRAVGRFLAIDQDQDALEEVARCYGPLGVEPVCASVRDVLEQRLAYVGCDLVYSIGLYDYLPKRVAQRLTQHLFAMVKPGGKLLVANFSPSARCCGYMEAILGWWLIYRDEVGMRDLAATIPSTHVAEVVTYAEPEGHINFLEITHT